MHALGLNSVVHNMKNNNKCCLDKKADMFLMYAK